MTQRAIIFLVLGAGAILGDIQESDITSLFN
jgi:hypothetical protein